MTDEVILSEIFKENSIEAVQWNRISRVVLDNPLVGSKSATLYLHTVTKVGQEIISDTLKQQITVSYDDSTSNTKFKILNPEDDSIIGESSFAEFLALVYSFSKYAALEEDKKASLRVIESEAETKRMQLQAELAAKRIALAEEQRLAMESLDSELQNQIDNH